MRSSRHAAAMGISAAALARDPFSGEYVLDI
jgi:hypothetical protein